MSITHNNTQCLAPLLLAVPIVVALPLSVGNRRRLPWNQRELKIHLGKKRIFFPKLAEAVPTGRVAYFRSFAKHIKNVKITKLK